MWPTARAGFLKKAEEAPLTNREAQALDQLLTELPGMNEALMFAFVRARRSDLFESLRAAVAHAVGRALAKSIPGYLDGKPSERETVEAWLNRAAAGPLAVLQRVVGDIQDDIKADRHREFAPVVQRSLMRLDIAEAIAHPPDPVGGIVSQLPVLKRGDKGASVRRVQGLLRARFPKLTDTTLKLNGTFGAGTEKWVKDAQRKAAIPVTGIVDEATWRALLGVAKDKPKREAAPDVPAARMSPTPV